MTKAEHQTGVWKTDRKGTVYSDEQWAELVTDRRTRWRDGIQVVQVLAYVVAFMTGGAALLVPEIDHRGVSGVIGAVALALGIGLTLGTHERSEPPHTTRYGDAPEPPEG
jgi:hypothetical protein